MGDNNDVMRLDYPRLCSTNLLFFMSITNIVGTV